MSFIPPPEVPPSPLSVHDRYSSPAAGSAKRRLFGDDPPGQTSGLSPVSSPAKRLTFGSSGTLKIGGQSGQTTILSVPLQGRRHVFITVWINEPRLTDIMQDIIRLLGLF